MSERIDAGVLLLYGEQAEITTEHRGAEDPERVPVARLIADTGIPRARQADSQLVAVISDKGQIERFERA